jgi:UDP-2,4-diacetamido-2,4,6-trideoxy-beta-L-altropyranose hydrolase
VTEDAPGREEVLALAASMPRVTLHGRVPSVVPLMLAADLALGAAGGSSWERCRLALPSLVVTTAPNQLENARALAEAGAATYLGDAADVSADTIAEALRRAMAHPDEVSRMSDSARSLVGAGLGRRVVADVVLGLARMSVYRLRPMTAEDLRLVFDWRGRPEVRSRMFTDHEISWDEHRAWWSRVSVDPDTDLRILEMDGRPVGFVSFGGLTDRPHGSEWGFYLGEPYLPAGTGSRMLALAADLAFAELGVERLTARTLAENERALAVQHGLGLVDEGTVTREDGRSAVLLGLDLAAWQHVRPDVMNRLFGEE